MKVTDMPGIPGGDHYPEFSEPASQVHVLFFFCFFFLLNKFPAFEFLFSDSRDHCSELICPLQLSSNRSMMRVFLLQGISG